MGLTSATWQAAVVLPVAKLPQKRRSRWRALLQQASQVSAMRSLPTTEQNTEERVTGIGPVSATWQAAVLPLNYTRNINFYN